MIPYVAMGIFQLSMKDETWSCLWKNVCLSHPTFPSDLEMWQDWQVQPVNPQTGRHNCIHNLRNCWQYAQIGQEMIVSKQWSVFLLKYGQCLRKSHNNNFFSDAWTNMFGMKLKKGGDYN